MTAAVRPASAWPVLLSIPVLVRIDGRRAASWLMFAAAAAAFPCLASMAATDGSPAPIAALLLGALFVVAAVGDLPLDACRQPQASPWLAMAWLCERAAWPLAGLMSAAAAWCATEGPTGPCTTALSALLVGGIAAGATVHLLRRGGANAADAASLTLAMALAAAWVGWPSGGGAAGFENLAMAVAAWGAIGLAVRGIDRRWGSGWEWLPDGESQPRRLRKVLTGMAMATALLGMVSWLFLDPSQALLFPVMAFVTYAALAIPEATLGDGVSDTIAWRRLHRTAAGPASPRFSVRPGSRRSALVAAVSDAAILGWPPLVAAALLAGRGEAFLEAVGTVFLLAITAAAVVAIAWAGDSLRASPETMHAAAMALAAAAALSVSMAVAGRMDSRANRPACPDCLRAMAGCRPGARTGGLVTLRKWRVPATLASHSKCEELG